MNKEGDWCDQRHENIVKVLPKSSSSCCGTKAGLGSVASSVSSSGPVKPALCSVTAAAARVVCAAWSWVSSMLHSVTRDMSCYVVR